ncbi:MAG TPA: MarR family transcriptional regulator [Pseudonocardia sp.]
MTAAVVAETPTGTPTETPTAAPVGIEKAELAGRLRIAAGRIARDGLGQKRVDGMTPSRITALAVLAAEGPLRMGELAVRLGISAPTASRLVECLVERGFIERVADPADGRATRVGLSPDGVVGLAAVREHGEGMLADRITALDDDALRALSAALPVLERLCGMPVRELPPEQRR